MAGFWIPWECGLTRKREVILIGKRLGVSPREAAAMCMEVWEWAQDQSVDGVLPGFTASDVSDAVKIEGIGDAMEGVGWLLNGESAVQIPNWDRFNGRCSKSRLRHTERQRRYRERHKGDA